MENNKYLSLIQAAEYLGISKSTMYKRVQKRELSYFRPSAGRVYFSIEMLDQYIESAKIDSQKEIDQKAKLELQKMVKG